MGMGIEIGIRTVVMVFWVFDFDIGYPGVEAGEYLHRCDAPFEQ